MIKVTITGDLDALKKLRFSPRLGIRKFLVVIDVRPRDEYDTAHLPFARSLPLAELEARLAELPTDKDIVAYCRGPFCVFADTAVRLLTARGYHARKLRDGVSEWQAAGLPLAMAAR